MSAHSPAAIEHQVHLNWQELAALSELVNKEPPQSPHRTIASNRIRTLNNANYQWNLQYKRLTGKLLFEHVQMPAAHIKSNLVAKDREAKRLNQKFKSTLDHGIGVADISLGRLEGLLRSASDANNSAVAGFVNTFTMTYWAEPKMIAKELLPSAKKALASARYALAHGHLSVAKVQLQKAVDTLTIGYQRLLEYNKKIEVSGARALAAIKLLKDVAITLASGGMNLTPGAGAGIEAVSTGAEEATLLVLAAATGDQKVGWHDVGNAVKNTAVDAGAAFVSGKLGKSVAGRLAKRYGWSKAVQDQVEKTVGNYVKDNFKELSKYVEANCRGKSKEYKANYIAIFLAPGIKSVPVPGMGTVGGAVSDADLQETVKESVLDPK